MPQENLRPYELVRSLIKLERVKVTVTISTHQKEDEKHMDLDEVSDLPITYRSDGTPHRPKVEGYGGKVHNKNQQTTET